MQKPTLNPEKLLSKNGDYFECEFGRFAITSKEGEVVFSKLIAKAEARARQEAVEEGFELEKYHSYLEINEHIRLCEGKHMQQVSFSTYHNALTQVCFDCKKVRTNIALSSSNKDTL